MHPQRKGVRQSLQANALHSRQRDTDTDKDTQTHTDTLRHTDAAKCTLQREDELAAQPAEQRSEVVPHDTRVVIHRHAVAVAAIAVARVGAEDDGITEEIVGFPVSGSAVVCDLLVTAEQDVLITCEGKGVRSVGGSIEGGVSRT